MSEVKRVVDYMKGLPSASEHAHSYATEFTERAARTAVMVIDGAEEEKKSIPMGEKDIIGRLNCNAKFTKSGMVDNLNLGVGVSLGLNGRVRREKKVAVDFRGGGEWHLEPAYSRALYSAKESTVHLIDEEQRRLIMSQCPTLAGSDANGIAVLSVHERISIPHDMRHVMMKMYLILCDYNLATVSKSTEMEVADDLTYPTQAWISPLDRLAAISSHDIVVDVDSFTPEEAGLLALASAAYPSVWYCGDNMYTKCNMVADDLLLISSSEVQLDRSLSWGSPDRLYHTMWSVAAKLGAVQALLSSIEAMRGKCRLMANMLPHIEGNTISSMIPKSYSQVCALNSDSSNHMVTNMPGYLATSMSLVSDILYGDCFEAVASCVAESLGAMGRLVSSGTPRTSSTINGLMRDYGLQHTSARENILLRNWEIMAGRPICWEFGVYLKEYLLGLATNIINGFDIQMPQLLTTVPSLMANNTAYGMCRGWRGPKHLLNSSKIEVAEASDQLCSIAWLVGDRSVRPPVFFNRSGKRPNHLGPDEARLGAEGEGDLRLGDTQLWLVDSVGGRVDENEETSRVLFKTEFAGTRCAMVYDYTAEAWVKQVSKPAGGGRESMAGEVPLPKENSSPGDYKTSSSPELSGVHWGALQKRSNASVLEQLKTISRGNALAPSHKPRYTRVGMDGKAEVGTYHVDGEPRTGVVINNLKPTAGCEMKVEKIDGDGGQSSVHAVLEDLQAHGLLSSGDAARGHSLFRSSAFADNLKGEVCAGALTDRWKMALEVYDPEDGTLRTVSGDADAHTVRLVRQGSELHAAIFSEGTGSKVTKIEPIVVGDAEKEQVAAFGNLFSPTI
ncbi:putative protease [Isaria javanica chrysovirus 1]|uniref:Putative protease n=1 Tax=Isaria javanica chrysovirus 1 TaxID=1930960 RepID=A0A1L6KVW7_9VIRU|nr:putative protease [Isaria javanica chrysovirus 1]APR73431.1 putative protease [Isaria javanica chrysovirus 1]